MILNVVYILQDRYQLGSSFEGMFLLMQGVKYSNLVSGVLRESDPDPRTVTPWPVSYPWISDTERVTLPEVFEMYGDPSYAPEWEEQIEQHRERYREVLNTDNRALGVDWITMHNSTYDIKNFTLRVVMEEDYLHPHEFSL